MQAWKLAVVLALVAVLMLSVGGARNSEEWLHDIRFLLSSYTPDAHEYFEERKASRWMASANEQLRQWHHRAAIAEWNFVTNITNENSQTLLQVKQQFSNWYQTARTEGKQFQTHSLNPDLKRQFQLFITSSEPLEAEKREEIDKLLSGMQTTFNTARVCLGGNATKQQTKTNDACLSLEPELQDLMSTSRDPTQLAAAWKGWRDAAGKPIRKLYAQFVKAVNLGARENGYSDFGEAWRQSMFFDTKNLPSMVDKLWQELRPLYLQLHAYVRRRLREHYGPSVVGNDGTIPAHLLGNMWAQNWIDIYPLVAPYPESAEDTENLNLALKKKYNEEDLFHLADNFYSSMGLPNMTELFWNYSMLLKPLDREVQCHASASDIFSPGDFRIKMCTEVSETYLETVHHEMGHVEYFMAYAHQPTVFRDGANCAFHEALGDTIALSVLSRTHLRRLGLESEELIDKRKQTINDLLEMALFKVGFLPFGLVVDRWRWQVFSGITTTKNYNRDWWKLRLDLQGIRAPVPRSEEDFDPGAKFHVPSNSPYVCYFVSFVVQFQFYKALCDASGHTGPLHLCDIFKSRLAGKKLKSMMELGSSKPWQEAMQSLTGTREISASALLEYFRPLRDWLETDNLVKGESLGWEGASINWQESEKPKVSRLMYHGNSPWVHLHRLVQQRSNL